MPLQQNQSADTTKMNTDGPGCPPAEAVGQAAQTAVPIDFEPALMETVVLRALANNSRGPADFTPREFHAEADPIYRLQSGSVRSARFRELFAKWFHRGQFEKPFDEALAELPEVQRQAARVTVTVAASSAEERADLPSHTGLEDSAKNRKLWIGIRVQPVRLLDAAPLRCWLRHELRYVRDMLDPAFAYRREDFAFGPAERLPQRVVQDRYALFWSLSVDARIERASLPPLHSKEHRVARLSAVFPDVSAADCASALESLGSSRGLSHPELLELARWPRALISDHGGNDEYRPVRGSPCPLCRFPTFAWADLLDPQAACIVAAIQAEYPTWAQQTGVCSNCFELFRIRQGVWT